MRRIVLAFVPVLSALSFVAACAESTADGFGGGSEGGAGQGGASTTTSASSTTTSSTTTSSSVTSTAASTTAASTTSVTTVSSTTSTSSGGSCDELLCIAECLIMEMGGQCVNGMCECSGEPIGSIAAISSVGSLTGSTGVFMEPEPADLPVDQLEFEHDGFEPAP